MGVLSTLSSENSERCPRTHTQTEMNLNSKQRQQQLSLRCVLSGCSCQRTLRYSREKDPIIFYSSPDVSREEHGFNEFIIFQLCPALGTYQILQRQWHVVDEELLLRH